MKYEVLVCISFLLFEDLKMQDASNIFLFIRISAPLHLSAHKKWSSSFLRQMSQSRTRKNSIVWLNQKYWFESAWAWNSYSALKLDQSVHFVWTNLFRSVSQRANSMTHRKWIIIHSTCYLWSFTNIHRFGLSDFTLLPMESCSCQDLW